MQSFVNEIVGRHFSKPVIRKLKKAGITVIDVTFLPDANGDFTKGETGYMLDDNGTGRLRSWLGVMEIFAEL